MGIYPAPGIFCIIFSKVKITESFQNGKVKAFGESACTADAVFANREGANQLWSSSLSELGEFPQVVFILWLFFFLIFP